MATILRQLQDTDWQKILELAFAAIPWDEAGNREWLNNRKNFEGVRRHYVAEKDTGQSIGYGAIEQGDKAGIFRVFIVMAAEHFDTVGDVVYAKLHDDLLQLKAHTLWMREYASDDVIQKFFARHGFTEKERFTIEGHAEMIIMIRQLG